MQCTTKLSGVRTAIPTEQAPWCGRAAAICAVLKEPMAQNQLLAAIPPRNLRGFGVSYFIIQRWKNAAAAA